MVLLHTLLRNGSFIEPRPIQHVFPEYEASNQQLAHQVSQKMGQIYYHSSASLLI